MIIFKINLKLTNKDNANKKKYEMEDQMNAESMEEAKVELMNECMS